MALVCRVAAVLSMESVELPGFFFCCGGNGHGLRSRRCSLIPLSIPLQAHETHRQNTGHQEATGIPFIALGREVFSQLFSDTGKSDEGQRKAYCRTDCVDQAFKKSNLSELPIWPHQYATVGRDQG